MKEIVEYITKSDFVKKYVYNHTWISGSSTNVYPIEVWMGGEKDVTNDIVLQLSGCKQWQERMLKKLANELVKNFGVVVKNVYVSRNDGSCPDEAYIKISKA
jgi:hypothetical protein